MNNPFSLDGQIALITGGGSGIGKAIAACMVAAGARVVICGRRGDVLEKACAELGNQASFVVHDVTENRQADVLLEATKKRAGTPGILVNCAGVHIKKALVDTTDADLLEILNTHLVGAYALTRSMVPMLERQGGGSILFITSMAAIFGIPQVSAYAAAKSSLLGVVRSLATEVCGKNIRVNAIAPGWIESDMTRHAMENDSDRRQRILSRTPLGAFGAPEDIGWGAVYLCSGAARFITGQQLVIDGGVSIGF